MRVLELFCGKKSVSNEFKKRGHKVFTIDIDLQHDPDLCIDILNFDVSMLPKEFLEPDVIWSSPPCQKFSVLTIPLYWDNYKRPKSWLTYKHLAIAKKSLEIIQTLSPKYFFIENPVGMLRKQHFMENIHRNTITYCQYGSQFRKPTDIWTNAIGWIPKKMCNNGDSCHITAKRGADTGIQSTSNFDSSIERAIIPIGLCKEIVDYCEGKNNIRQEQLECIKR